jgi:hypothetical protein
MSLFDVSGKLVATRKGNGDVALDISNMAKGTNFLSVKTERTSWTSKIAVSEEIQLRIRNYEFPVD